MNTKSKNGFINVALIITLVALAGIAMSLELLKDSTEKTTAPDTTNTPSNTTNQNSPDNFSGNSNPSQKTLLRACPEEWFVNMMPGTGGAEASVSGYFIYKGARREIAEFDFNWVKANCSVQPQVVY